jgi:hypothetical protein
MAKRGAVLGLALCLLFLMPGYSWAKTHKTLHVKGKITAVHLDRNTAELEKKSGELVTFSITPTTKYVKDKKPMAVADLKRDTKVSAHCVSKDGKLTATKVVIEASKK